MYSEYIDNNKNRDILLIHSVPSSSELFEKHIPILSEKYNIVQIDLPGFGKSKKLNAFNIDEITSEIVEILKDLNIIKFDVWGISLGGVIALKLSEKIKIENLIIESAPFCTEQIHTKEFKAINVLEWILTKTKSQKFFNNLKERSKLFRNILILVYRFVNIGHNIHISNAFMDKFIVDINIEVLFITLKYLQNFNILDLLKIDNNYVFIYDKLDPVIWYSQVIPEIEKCSRKKIITYEFKEHAPSVIFGEKISKDVLSMIS